MLSPLLATKLYLPPARLNRVPRPRLHEKLNSIRPLTVIVAPAGFGKTTALSEWIPTCKHCVSWLSLDDGDNDPARFWIYVVAAVQKLRADLGGSALEMLQLTQPPPITSILTTLINEIALFSDDFSIVIDDYHIIKTEAIHEALTFLLDHLPPNMRVILTARADPPLPLSRLRARNQLAELRASDLRFTPDEAAAFLNEVMGLKLPPEDIAALETRTEGWIAGLQLAALSMQGQADTSGFIQAFTGSNRFILDYLVEEVLNRHPKGTLDFLLRTSILDRVTASLCDAVTGRSDSQGILEDFEHANLFIVPLDEERKWYRYHHLFVDLLRARLQQSEQDQVPELHRRASTRFEQMGLLAEAVDHSLAAQDFNQAIRLIEKVSKAMWQRGEVTQLQSWIAALPPHLQQTRPQLLLAQAWSTLAVGKFIEAQSKSRIAEEALREFDEEEARQLHAEVRAIQSVLAGYWQDSAKSVELAHQALRHLPEHDDFMRGILAYTLGRAYLSLNDLGAAIQKLAEAAALSRTAGDLSTASYALVALGAELETQGQLHLAAARYREIIEFVQKDGRPLPFTAAAGAYVRLSSVLFEWDQLEEASTCANQGIELSRQFQNNGAFFVGYLVLTRVFMARGDLMRALDTWRQAEALARTDTMLRATLKMVEALRAQLWLYEGNLADAAQWATGCENDLRFPSRGDWADVRQLSRMHDYECFTLAHVRMAQTQWSEVLNLLLRLQPVVETGVRKASLIEIMAIRALAYRAQGNTADALITFERALSLAEPEGYIRIFVDEGEPMREIIGHWRLKTGKHKDPTEAQTRLMTYADKLLKTFTDNAPQLAITDKPVNSPVLQSSLLEPLSARELEVLHLIAEGLSNREIADRLFITINTVKKHTRLTFDKLDVANRTHAVARARELGLL